MAEKEDNERDEFEGCISKYQYFESIESKKRFTQWLGNRLSNKYQYTNSAKNVDRNMSCNTIAHI